MQCAFCKEIIDDDSFYCDMCGEEIKACPSCKQPGKGKICTVCGTPLASLKPQDGPPDESGTSGTQTPPPLGFKSPSSSGTAENIYRLADAETLKPIVPQLRLLNKNINVDLKIDDNSIIGRTTGQYVATFGSFKQISGKHCRFNYDPAKGWTVTDLASKYKTMYNEQELVPNIPQALSDQTYLKIVDIEFFVRIIPERQRIMP